MNIESRISEADFRRHFIPEAQTSITADINGNPSKERETFEKYQNSSRYMNIDSITTNESSSNRTPMKNVENVPNTSSPEGAGVVIDIKSSVEEDGSLAGSSSAPSCQPSLAKPMLLPYSYKGALPKSRILTRKTEENVATNELSAESPLIGHVDKALPESSSIPHTDVNMNVNFSINNNKKAYVKNNKSSNFFERLVHTCQICGYTDRRAKIIQHYENEKNISRCDICQQQIFSDNTLQNHLKEVHDIKEELKSFFQCRECIENFQQRNDYLQHLLGHVARYCYSCDECTFTSSTEDSLSNHKEKAHDEDM